MKFVRSERGGEGEGGGDGEREGGRERGRERGREGERGREREGGRTRERVERAREYSNKPIVISSSRPADQKQNRNFAFPQTGAMSIQSISRSKNFYKQEDKQ